MSYTNDSPGRTLAPSARSTSNLAARSPLAAPNAAALAALSRATGSLSLEDDHKPMYWEKKDWFRLIDDEVSVSASTVFHRPPQLVSCSAHREIEEIASYRNPRDHYHSRQRCQSFTRRFGWNGKGKDDSTSQCENQNSHRRRPWSLRSTQSVNIRIN